MPKPMSKPPASCRNQQMRRQAELLQPALSGIDPGIIRYPARAVAEVEASELVFVVGQGVRTLALGFSKIRARMASTKNSPAPKINMRTDANRNVYGSAA